MADAPGNVPLRIHAAGDTHIGGRAHNEDAILLRPDLNLYLVADGAGGHNAGHLASALSTTAAAHYFESTQREAEQAPPFDEMGLSWSARRLATAFQRANREVREIAASADRFDGMGSTMVAAYFDLANATLVLGHVGDSRCYRLRDGHLERLTTDHTLINEVLELAPDIAPERAASLPRNVITNALGMEDRVRVSARTYEVVPGDRYLLCSDGLTDEVDDGQIQQALTLGSSASESARILIDLALDGGARDNIGVIVLAVRVSQGVGKLPQMPVPPRRRHIQDAAATETFEDEAPEAELESASVEISLDDADDYEVIKVEDPDDEDAPEIEIVMNKRQREVQRKRRADDTIITKTEP
ncbi:MAG: serine/threonine-protein phosphatase [Myxococcales bacterium]|nr:serine/threonine-protein phosphatase [Myxococcales bacterium]